MTASSQRGNSDTSIVDVVEELERLRVALVRLLSGGAGLRAPSVDTLGADEAALASLLLRARAALLEHPAAARSALSFLTAEGRRFAATDEGRSWQQALHASPSVERLREVWEAISLNVYDRESAQTDTTVPSAWLDLLDDLAAGADVPPAVLDALQPPGWT